MRKPDRSGLHAALLCATALACAPGISGAMEEGFYMGFSASVEHMDVDIVKTTDNTPPNNGTISEGKIFHVRDSDSGTASGFGGLVGYAFPLGDRGLYLSAEIDLVYHRGKARGMIPWTRDEEGRAEHNVDPSFTWPLGGENWPDYWAFEKDYSYGLTLRLGGRPDFVTSALGSGAGLYALLGFRRTEADYSLAFEGCNSPDNCPAGRADVRYVMGTDAADGDYDAWTAGIGVHASLGERLAMQVETYYIDYDREDLVFLDNDIIRVTHAPEVEEIGLRLRLLRYF